MIRISELTFDAWGRRFFDSASVTLPPGAKVGLVGRNGVGKSTLFKLILDRLHPGGGEITWPKAARISSVDQEHPATPVSLIDTILAADIERAELIVRLDTAAPEDLGDIYMRLIEIDADAAPSRAAEILAGGQLCEGTMYYLFLKPDAVSQFALPASKKAAPPADGSKAPAKAATKPPSVPTRPT